MTIQRVISCDFGSLAHLGIYKGCPEDISALPATVAKIALDNSSPQRRETAEKFNISYLPTGTQI